MKEFAIDHKLLSDWATAMFAAAGMPAEEAGIVARALVKTSLWGIDSHGIARITHYLGRLENGTINKSPRLHFSKTAAATGKMDGDDGHGILIMTRATEHAIELAKASGTGVVGAFNSSHCGAIGLYTRQVTEAGMVGISFTHADALVVPHGGNKAFFGTNPISIAFPTENPDEPICVDMATSIVPWNFVMNARREGTKIPLGFGVDKEGKDNENPHEVSAVKPMAEHKGYALAFLIDMLCGPLNAMNFGPNMTSMYKDLDKKRKLGSLVIAIDPERFAGREFVQKAGMAVINQVRSHGDKVLFPGEPEYLRLKERSKNGIPLSETLLEDFRNWSRKLSVSSPF